ncbi:sphingosine N-acyltransferase lag1 [Podila epicladia]|nr:sphingosine N-acyltransferase lag1 [Podila epicladia]
MQSPTVSPAGQSTTTSLRPRLPAYERSNSFRRKASIDSETGQPHHYHHRRHHHHDPTKGRSPSPPEGVARLVASSNTDPTRREESQYSINADGFLVPTRTVVEQSWSSFLIQHQLVLSGSVILATFLSHVLIMSKERRDGHSLDWVASLTAMIPPPIWENLPREWSAASVGGPGMARKWSVKPGAYNPNEAWSSQAMALQYKNVVVDAATGATQVLYGKGWNDLYMVFVWVMIWTALREAFMTFVLIPLGRSFEVGEIKTTTSKGATGNEAQGGATTVQDDDQDQLNKRTTSRASLAIRLKKEEHAREGKLLRFAEQGWLVIYDGCMWTFGMYLLYNSEYWADTTFYWRDYPKTLLSGTMKWYYLIQFAFWLQQLCLAILGIEKRRKDFLEFMIHHIITCLLIGFSYSFNLTSVGHAVLCAMDFSDIVLSACKMLKYMHKDQAADVGFVFFVITWVMSRHYYYGVIVWSCFVEAPIYANQTWDPARGMYFTPRVLQGFQVLLCSLYAVLLFWLAMIGRVALKVLKGENSEDVRSEDEEEEEEGVQKDMKQQVKIQKEIKIDS